jgi:hypothetical protein
VPDALVGVELGSVARQPLQVQAFSGPWHRKSLTGWPPWMGEPSQMTSNLPWILRSSRRRKRTTSGEW